MSSHALLNRVNLRSVCALTAVALALLSTALALNNHVAMFGATALAGAALAVPGFAGIGDREFRRRSADAWARFGSAEFRGGALLAALCIPLILWSGWEFIQRDEHYQSAYIAWIAGALLLLAGFCLMDRRASELYGRLRSGIVVCVDWGTVARWGLLTLTLCTAATVRFVDLELHPVGMDRDEMQHLTHSLTLGDSSDVPPYVKGMTTPAAYPMMVHRTAKLVGASAATPRLVSAFIGVVGVFAVFLLGRRIMGWPMGLLAAGVLASLSWDINFSRIGWENIAAPTCAALAAWGALRALSTGRISDFALAGALAASGFWFYEAYYAFPLVLAFVLLYGFVRARSELRRRVVVGALVMGLLGTAWTGPILAYAVDDPAGFTGRVRTQFAFDERRMAVELEQLPGTVLDYLRCLHVEGDRGFRHNLDSKPMMDPLTGAMLILGLALVVTRWRQVGLVMLLVWIPVMMLPGVLSEVSNGIIARRVLGTLPALALLAALPLALSWRGVAHCTRWWRWPARGAVIAVVVAAAGLGTHHYFVAQPTEPRSYREYNTANTLVAYDIPERLDSGYAVAVSTSWDTDLQDWARLLTVWPAPVVLGIPDSIPIDPRAVGDRRGLVVYVRDQAKSTADALQRMYPEARSDEVVLPSSVMPLFYRVTIERDDLWAVAGLSRVHGPALLDAGALGAAAGVDYRGFLHIRRNGFYEFALRDGAGVSVSLQGDALFSGGSAKDGLYMKAGLYEIKVNVGADVAAGAALLWKEPDALDFASLGVPNLYHDIAGAGD